MASPQSSPPRRMLATKASQCGLIPCPQDASLLDRHGTFDYNLAPQRLRPSSLVEQGLSLMGTLTPQSSCSLLEPERSLNQNPDPEETLNSRSTLFCHCMKPTIFVSSLFPAIAAAMQILLLLYFLAVYVSLSPKPNGGRERVSPVYSIWPYIACVGSIRLAAYRVFGFLIAFFSFSTFAIDMFFHRDCVVAKGLRWVRLLNSCVADIMLIAVVFVNDDKTSHMHLYLVSVQIIAFAAVMCLTWAIDRSMGKNYGLLRTDRKAVLTMRWRYAVYAIAMPVALLTVLGIWAAHDNLEIQTKGTRAHVLAGMSAVCEWLYQLVSVAFMLSLAYEFYLAEHFAEVRMRSERVGEKTGSRLSGRSHQSRLPLVVEYQRVDVLPQNVVMEQ